MVIDDSFHLELDFPPGHETTIPEHKTIHFNIVDHGTTEIGRLYRNTSDLGWHLIMYVVPPWNPQRFNCWLGIYPTLDMALKDFALARGSWVDA